MSDHTRKITNFVLQQGLEAPPAESCSVAYSGLLFQPRVIGVVVMAASLAQSPTIFAVLAAVLWWGAAFPRLNLFDAVYNRVFARRSGFRLHAAPSPRRFAQALAGSLSLLAATLLTFGRPIAAIVVEVSLLSAIAVLVFGGFCFGSYLFHLLKGRKAFANRTLPWSRAT